VDTDRDRDIYLTEVHEENRQLVYEIMREKMGNRIQEEVPDENRTGTTPDETYA
jgi:GTPase Era involved in 16S rRNA processing